MARSKFVWQVTTEDMVVTYVFAQTVTQILDNFDDDTDRIISIQRYDLEINYDLSTLPDKTINVPFVD